MSEEPYLISSVPRALRAYDLQPPLKLLLPCTDRGRRHDSTSVGIESALLTRDDYGACACPGGHPAVVTWTLMVPCDAMPHCVTCECGLGHILVLTEADVANLREMLA